MAQAAAACLRCLTSSRRPEPERPGARCKTALLQRIGAAALLARVGYIHLHLWLEGYRHIPVSGPLFLLDAIAACAFAAALLAWPRPVTGLLAAGFTSSTLALIISLAAGLFGFRESIHPSYVVESLVIETTAVLVLLSWTLLVTAGGQDRGRPIRLRRRERDRPRSDAPAASAAPAAGSKR